MHGLTNLKITIALSAVTLAGACLCHSCYKCQHISADMALNSKEQMPHRQYYGTDTWPRFWQWFLDHDKSRSDVYDNLMWCKRSASCIQSKGIHTWSKVQADGRATQDKKNDKTTCTYISRHFGMEKTDKCNEPQDSSVHWWQNWWYTHYFLDIIVLNSFLCTACETKMTHRDIPCCGTWFQVRLFVSTGDVRVSETQNISLNILFAKFPTAHNHINTHRPAHGCIGWKRLISIIIRVCFVLGSMCLAIYLYHQ